MIVWTFQAKKAVVRHIACGTDHALAVDVDGDVYSWGLGNYGNLGHGDTRNEDKPKLIEKLKGAGVIMAAGGSKHSLVVTAKGAVWSWGHGEKGRLGHGEIRGALVPQVVEDLNSRVFIVQVAAGEAHSACVSDNGVLYTWGDGAFGRLGHGDETSLYTPTIVDALQPYTIRQVIVYLCHIYFGFLPNP